MLKIISRERMKKLFLLDIFLLLQVREVFLTTE